MGEALGEALLAGLMFVGYLSLTVGIAALAGIVGFFAFLGKAFTVVKVTKIIAAVCAGLFALPFVLGGLSALGDAAERSREEAEASRRYKEQRTKLILAVESGNIKKVEKLLKKGSDPNEVKNGRTALSVACGEYPKEEIQVYDDIVELLLNSGADANSAPKTNELLRRKGEYTGVIAKKSRPILFAIHNRRDGALRLLIEHGAEINSYNPDTHEGYSFMPVQSALGSGSYKCAEILLEAGAKTGYYMYGYNDSVENKTLIAELFDGPESEKTQPVKMHILEMLLEKGIDVNEAEEKGRTALHYAVKWNWSELRIPLAEKLVEAGANVNATDHEGNTPLMTASDRYDFLPQIEFLCSHGADISLKNKAGKTALDIFLENHASNSQKERPEYTRAIELLTPKKISSSEKNEQIKQTDELKISANETFVTEIATPADEKLIAKADALSENDFSAGKLPEPNAKTEHTHPAPAAHIELDDMSDNW